jgi:NTE family protein
MTVREERRTIDMAFLPSFLPNSGTGFPDALRERLRSFKLLEGMSDAALRRVLGQCDWFSLPGGTQLVREGENDRAAFLVMSGSLGVFLPQEEGPPHMVAHIPVGETVGEMSLLTGETHSAKIVALRDTELLRLNARAFDALLTRNPHVMLNLLKVMTERLRQTTRGADQKIQPKTFAVVPLQRGLAETAVARRMTEVLVGMGAKAAVLDSSAAAETTDWFYRFEAAHDIVFYQGDEPESSWTNFCIRQADRILLLARADQRLPVHPFTRRFFKRDLGVPPELLLVHPSGGSHVVPNHIELRNDLYGTHHHVRENDTDDIARLARFVSGRAVNIVLAGGGARGFAHIGVLKALKEAGVPFDYVAGVSMGAVIAAGVAMEWDIPELRWRVKAAFVDTNPLSDFTLPLIALVKGGKVSRLLREHFGDTRIEDLAKPFFCVSADLTTGRDYIHRSGPVWRALRASVALPGILPPVTQDDGRLLVDGGVMNNLPVDIMTTEARGPIIAVDVAGEIDLRAKDPRYGERSIWSLIAQRMRGSPSIVSILMRAGTMGSDLQRRMVRNQADFLFEPNLDKISMGDWKSFETCIDLGYAYTAREIERHGVPMSRFWTAGPAVEVHPGR